MQDPQSLHKYAYVHGDPIQGVDPTGQFSLGGALVSIGIGFGMVSQELSSGALIVGLIETGGKPGFDARQAGLLLIAIGDFQRGFALYNYGNQLVSLTFNVIDQLDSVIGFGYLAGLSAVGVYAVVKNFDELPGIVQSLVRFGKKNSARFSNAGIQGTQSAAQSLASRASVIRNGIADDSVAVAAVRVRNTLTGQESVLVARNGDKNLPDNLLNSGEVKVSGHGRSRTEGWHAEANIAEWLRRRNNRASGDYNGDWVIKEGGASTDVCPNQCQTMLDAFDLKVDGPRFWRE